MFIVGMLLICGFMTAAICDANGRAVLVGFFGGILLGPLAVFLAYVTLDDAITIEHQLLARGIMKHCPQCTERVGVEARICHFCHHDVTAAIVGASDVRVESGYSSCRASQKGWPKHTPPLFRELDEVGYSRTKQRDPSSVPARMLSRSFAST